MIFQSIKIIDEFYYILIKLLTRFRIFLLIFDLKIEIAIEDILKIRHIKFLIDGDILSIVYFFLTFLYIGRNPVEVNFNKINSDFFRDVITTIIIKLLIILSSVDSEML
jgi:hypothetical protein